VQDLMGGIRMTAPKSRATPKQKAAALAARAEGRAYNGAPPVIPHGVDARSSGACLTCHAKGARVNGKVAPPISHPPYASCTQCHAPHTGRLGTVATLPANRFVGAPSPGPGRRAWIGAPPTIPHTTWMRQSCIACHGPAGKPGLRTTHPQRGSCTQCHAPGTHLHPTGLLR
jgi:cytochrome c-type protein NapB